MRLTIFILCIVLSGPVLGQDGTGIIKGKVTDKVNNQPVPFANVVVQDTDIGGTTREDGTYTITGVPAGLVNLKVSYVGFKPKTVYEVQVNPDRPTVVDIQLTQSSTDLEAVEVKSEVFSKSEESPVSLNTIGASEIQRNPGGNRDISRAIQVLPGVANNVAFRNDIIIRGGAPSENAFYLDGIEVPNINHFATQGASGGPVGLINVNFIEEVDFYSGSFPANRGNALSSVLELRQKEGNPDSLKTNFTLGSSDVGLTFDGPIGEDANFIFSARRSYLQFLFEVIQLPFLPTYNDAQFKVNYRIDEKNQISLIGLGAYDDFVLNTSTALDTDDEETFERNRYLINNLPVFDQWNYTIGARYKHFSKNSFQTLVISRNHLFNGSEKYRNNDSSNPENLILDLESDEIENKTRFEHTARFNGYKLTVGAGAEHAIYTNSTFNRIYNSAGEERIVDFSSRLSLNTFSTFGQLSKSLFENRLTLTAGLRTDFSDYSSETINPLEQLSPRFGGSYSISAKLSFNASVARYYKLPPYTILGYRNSAGDLVNKENGITYIQSDQVIAGFEYFLEKQNTKLSVEGFYKRYDDYPFLLRDSITLANLGADFGVVGNEPAESTSEGRAYGLEFLAQRKLYKGLYGILAVTLVRSEFKDKNGDYVPSAWDNQYIISLTAGKKFGKNWEIGARFGYQGGAPFTPYDRNLTALKSVWNVEQEGVPDYDRLNALRGPDIYFLDIRIDKRFYFDKWNLNVYLDVRNATGAEFEQQPYLDVQRNSDGEPITDPENENRFLLEEIPNFSGGVLPSIGIVAEF